MTRVEEWTNADTGVGAAIAAGNQALKGIWALLVITATAKSSKISLLINLVAPPITGAVRKG